MHRTVGELLLATVLVAGAVVAGTGRLEAADGALEAETMTLPSNSGHAYADEAASGDRALLVWSNRAATAEATLGRTAGLVVRARGDQCDGAPVMTVRIDGVAVLARAVYATGWSDHEEGVSVQPGRHEVSISFENDHVSEDCDRNLRVDRVSFVAPPRELYVDPHSAAKRQADAWRESRPADAAQMDKVAAQAQAFWLGDWSGGVRAAADAVVTPAAAAGRVPVLVTYNIPNRDCGGYSGGGNTPDGYRSWIRELADGIGEREAVVVLEPDALALADCLSQRDRSVRYELLRDAVAVLESRSSVSTYIDAGHSRWLSPEDAASRLIDAGVGQADGFSLNVSNFGATLGEVAYGEDISSRVGWKHFVVDTGRNGHGPEPSGEWCNPSGRALGERPTLHTERALVDAYLWLKRPGESDGSCNGGPGAGQWWADYALDLAQRAAY